MSGLIYEIINFSKPKLWMWILNAVLSAGITYLVFIGAGGTGISNQIFMKYPFLFLCIVLIYLSCVLGILLMEMSVMTCYRMYHKMHCMEESDLLVENSASSILKLLKTDKSPSEVLTAYYQTLSRICNINGGEDENGELPENMPFSTDILKMLNFNAILEDENFSPEQSIQNMRETFLIKLRQELETDFLVEYLSKKSDLQMIEMLSKNHCFFEYALPQMKKLSDDLEFILRLVSCLVADWCIDVYSRVYGVDKNIILPNGEYNEYENTVKELNTFRNYLIDGRVKVGHIIKFGFSAERKEIRAIEGKLFDIYRKCNDILNQ